MKSKAKPSLRSDTHDFSGLSNRFSNLEIEEPEEIEDTSAITFVNPSTKPKTAAPVSVDVYELEPENEWDRAFEVYCFFEDLHRIQDFLGDTWSQYKEGTIDLMSATLVSNAAFDIVRREEEEVNSFIFGHKNLMQNYRAWYSTLKPSRGI